MSGDEPEPSAKKQKEFHSVALRNDLTCLGLGKYGSIATVTPIPEQYIRTSSYQQVLETSNRSSKIVMWPKRGWNFPTDYDCALQRYKYLEQDKVYRA